jgi:hypothetical protein
MNNYLTAVKKNLFGIGINLYLKFNYSAEQTKIYFFQDSALFVDINIFITTINY